MARPKKQPAELRTELLQLRLTVAERFEIAEAAAAAGMTDTAYARMQALKGRVVIREHTTLDHAAFDQLRRIGVNLNQLTRLANATGEMPPKLSGLFAELDAFLSRELSGHGPGPTGTPPRPGGLADGP
ncbi:MAG: MobC family plasmid mobilization relaxosome protein [Hyphomicrobiales bacterium]|nr:MobC family plasmid mobilization relaxosome protein [Hyphomicrobiales bacterium]